jgi:hypothetical protein
METALMPYSNRSPLKAESDISLSHFQVKWIRCTAENVSDTKTRAEPAQMETALTHG